MTNEKEETKTDAISHDEAATNRILIKEDIKKYGLAKAQAFEQLARLDSLIAECELALADIDRREAAVVYPEPAKPQDKEA